MNAPDEPPRSNPFSTRFIRPGALPFLFEGEESAEHLVTKLAEQRWLGQIIGPHGSGKSTLLAALEEPLRTAGRRSWLASLHDGERRMPRGWQHDASAQQANLVVIDGYEQLSYWQRWLLKATCRRRGWGMLVTAHKDVGLPTLYETSTSLDALQQVVGKLLAGEPEGLPPELVAAAYQEAGGDVRETLFRLYDAWEAERRRTAR